MGNIKCVPKIRQCPLSLSYNFNCIYIYTDCKDRYGTYKVLEEEHKPVK